MAYSINPHLPRARAIAMQLLIRDQLPVVVVANHCGIARFDNGGAFFEAHVIA